VYGEPAAGSEGRMLLEALAAAGVRYRGAIGPEAVPTTLASYDALLLPTMWPTEGYPGVVLEAFAAGVPVIATRWNALPELVDDSCGVLIEPASVDALAAAMIRVREDAGGWEEMRRGALARAGEYDAGAWSGLLREWIEEVVHRNGL
jgi:glycosyltransferase involved in cell wall biosynthesis